MKKIYIEPILEIEDVKLDELMLSSPLKVEDNDALNTGFTFDDFFKFEE